MSEINSKKSELTEALEFLQNYINNKSEFEAKALKALQIYEKIKKHQTKYQQNNPEKIKIICKRYYENKKLRDPTFLEKQREKSKIQYQKKKKLLQENNCEINALLPNLTPTLIE